MRILLARITSVNMDWIKLADYMRCKGRGIYSPAQRLYRTSKILFHRIKMFFILLLLLFCTTTNKCRIISQIFHTPTCFDTIVSSSGKLVINTLPRYTSISKYSCWQLLTYSMEQSPSWVANWSASSQEIPHIIWNPKVHYRIHKCPPPILSQLFPVHFPFPEDPS